MLFSKLKHEEELLPPPPPFPSMEIKEEKISREIKPKKAAKEDKEFEGLLKDFESLKEKKETARVKKKSLAAKKPAIPKKPEVKKAKAAEKKIIKPERIKARELKEKKPVQLRKLKAVKTTKIAKPKGAFKDIDFMFPEKLGKHPEEEIGLPEELKAEKDLELPETLEDLDIEDFGKELGIEDDFGIKEQEEKPREIQEAEEEIKSAIERIKEKEEPSFFKRFFSKQKGAEEKEELFPEISETDDLSTIQNNINKARGALMKFDLETARRNYIEIMKVYNSLKPEEQAKVYHEIRDLYFERKSAEELKV